jgi:predicted dehydrogenase
MFLCSYELKRGSTMSGKARIGFIGAGWWATEFQIPYFAARPDVELVAVCRLGAAELALVRDRFGFQHATEDYQELVRYDLDGVVVASPHTWHFAHAQAALAAGRHVLVEKPMTTRGGEARELVRLAEASGRQIVVPQGWSFTHYATVAERLVRDGALGEVRHIVCQMASALSDLMGGEGLAETAGATFRPPASTWADPRQAGGYGWGQLCHALGLMFGITGLEPQSAYALMGASPSGADYYDAITLRCTNGATAVVSGSATIPKPQGAANDRSKGYQIDLRVFGTEGMLLLDIERERCLIRRNDGADTIIPMQPGDGDYPAAAPFPVFIDICRGLPVLNPAPGAVGACVVEVLEAAYQSAQSGTPVVIR